LPRQEASGFSAEKPLWREKWLRNESGSDGFAQRNDELARGNEKSAVLFAQKCRKNCKFATREIAACGESRAQAREEAIAGRRKI